jgi:DNA-binding response OmpR family regulator
MECSTAYETHTVLAAPEEPEAVADRAPKTRPATSSRCRLIPRGGGRAMDAPTLAMSRYGSMLALSGTDRALLGVFLRHAGQIISREWLADLLGLSVEALDGHVQALREALRSAGSICVLYTVEGLGYVLWRR